MKPIFILILILLVQLAFATHVPSNKAEQLAKRFYFERVNQVKKKQFKDLQLDLIYTEVAQTDNLFYIFNVNINEGYVVISADNSTNPILGYSFEGSFVTSQKSPGLNAVLKSFSQQITQAIQTKAQPTDKIIKAWGEIEKITSKSTKNIITVGPLLLTTWNQDSYYAVDCPYDSVAGKRVYAGCVATAMAQVMKYYNYPVQGQGSHTHNSSYGDLYVNYANQTYNWENMPNALNQSNAEVAKLIYHCGVAIDMNYSPDGSGAWPQDAADALVNYYKYDPNISLERKDDYTDEDWKSLIRNEINNSRPTMYTGFGDASGHEWNCDGYQGNSHFHMNWGWGGHNNGWWTLDNLTPQGNLGEWQDAVINIKPLSNYPVLCSGIRTINSYQGTIEDGSGIENCNTNIDCFWLIKPDCGKYLTLTFDRFDIEEQDTIYVYDGESIDDSLLIKFTGQDTSVTIPPIYSSQGKLLIRFMTNNSITSKGWNASYESDQCKYLETIFTESGVIEDGSKDCDYKKSKLCKWVIKPENATSININFTEFDLAADNDAVYIYNDTIINTSTLVSKYTYQNPPSSSITINSNIAMVRFYSSTEIVAGGWALNYNSVISGIDQAGETFLFSIYPNPITDNSIIKLELNYQNDVQLQIVDIMGNTVGAITKNLNYGIHEIPLNLIATNLSNGVYNIRCKIGSQIINKKIICIK